MIEMSSLPKVNIKLEEGFIHCPYIPDITLVNMKESPYEIKIGHKARRLEKDV